MPRKISLGFTLTLLLAATMACSPYRVHHQAPRAGKKAAKAPMTFLNFQARQSCGCH